MPMQEDQPVSHQHPFSVAGIPSVATDKVPAIWKKGDVILDQYEVMGTLGEGGMGTVYKIHHREWNIDLAVKSPKPEILTKAEGKENFEREAETWVNLDLHPHIVNCYYVQTLGGLPRIFAEYVAGGSLSNWIRTDTGPGRLYEGGHEKALERMLDVAIQFAWGLHYAHEQGLVHQDVKPLNVMMTPDGVAKVTDFGLAKARELVGEASVPRESGEQSILVSNAGLMTPAYCSPEQASRQRLSRKTDIWSWGVSILHMFVGPVKPIPWKLGPLVREYLARHARQDQAVPVMPAEMVKLLARCFQPHPEDRPATMLEIAAALQEIYKRELGRPYPRQAPKPVELLADSLNNRALSRYHLGKVEEAKQVWEQALQVDPQHLETIYNRGVVLWHRAELTDDVLVQHLEAILTEQGQRWQAAYLLAQVHLERGDADTALPLLAKAVRQAPGERDVQRLLERAQAGTMVTGRGLRTFRGHRSEVISVSLSADSRLALSGSLDKTVRLWEVATGRCLCIFEGHTDAVSSVSLSADSRLALSGSFDNTMRLWEVATGQCLRVFEGYTSKVISVSLSVDGRLALSGSRDKTVRLWEVATGQCLRTFEGHTDSVWSVSLSVDGQLALSGSRDKTVRLWEVTTGRCLRTLRGHMSKVSLSADGRLALLGRSDRTVQLWKLPREHSFCPLQLSQLRSAADLSDVESQAAALLQQAQDAWEVARFTEALPLVRKLRALPGWERTSTSLQAWARLFPHCSKVSIRTAWLARTLQGHTDAVSSVSLSADGRLALSASRDKTVRLWEVTTGQCLRVFEGHTDAVISVSLSADGRLALSASGDKTVRLWEVATGQCLRTFEGHTDSVWSVSLSADGRLALSGSGDSTVRLWELDWELQAHDAVDWDEGALATLETFLAVHTPYAGVLRPGRKPTKQEIQQALTRRGKPTWTEQDFQELIRRLQDVGYGWLRPEGVLCKLEEMAASWQRPSL